MHKMTRAQCAAVFARGTAVHSPHFLVRFSYTEELHSRLAVVVPKRVEKSAVLRHLLKRRVRNVLARISSDISQARDIVVISKQGAQKLPFEKIEQELMKIFGGRGQ
ncbi:MAG TPA: ribonuclease P protein component [Candidatus Paceibacterota bacterium]